jgi:hypothetical protein
MLVQDLEGCNLDPHRPPPLGLLISKQKQNCCLGGYNHPKSQLLPHPFVQQWSDNMILIPSLSSSLKTKDVCKVTYPLYKTLILLAWPWWGVSRDVNKL